MPSASNKRLSFRTIRRIDPTHAHGIFRSRLALRLVWTTSFHRMNVSVFDLFKLGVGPSSSHTMGPMTAAHRFLERLGPDLARTARVETTLYASLALTGRGHATDRAVIL